MSNERVPYCFRCMLPIGKEFGTNCICTVPDVMGASITERLIRKGRESGYNPDLSDIMPSLAPDDVECRDGVCYYSIPTSKVVKPEPFEGKSVLTYLLQLPYIAVFKIVSSLVTRGAKHILFRKANSLEEVRTILTAHYDSMYEQHEKEMRLYVRQELEKALLPPEIPGYSETDLVKSYLI